MSSIRSHRHRRVLPAAPLFALLTALLWMWACAARPGHTAATAAVPAGKTRTDDIAADEVMWDDAPSGLDEITGEPFEAVANVFVEDGPDRIGHRCLKAQGRESTDAS